MCSRQDVCQIARESNDTTDPDRLNTRTNSLSSWKANNISWEAKMVSLSLIAMTVCR